MKHTAKELHIEVDEKLRHGIDNDSIKRTRHTIVRRDSHKLRKRST